jgi:hypothetical protein
MEKDPGLHSRYAAAILALIILLAFGGISWWHRTASQRAGSPVMQEAFEDSSDDVTEDEVSLEDNAPLLDDSKNGWSIYRSEGQGYVLRYPKGWNLVEAKAGEEIQGTEESLTLLGREIEKASSWGIPSGRGPTVPLSAHHIEESRGKQGEIGSLLRPTFPMQANVCQPVLKPCPRSDLIRIIRSGVQVPPPAPRKTKGL